MPSIHELSRFFDQYLHEEKGRLERTNKRALARLEAIGDLLQAIDDGYIALTYPERASVKDDA